MNFLQNDINVFNITWIMSLHYLVKLELLLAHVLPLNCCRKKLQNLSHVNCVPRIRQIWIQYVENIARDGLQNKHHWYRVINNAIDKWSAMTTWFSLDHSVTRSLMHILYIFSFYTPTRCNQMDTNVANLWSQLRWNKFVGFFL